MSQSLPQIWSVLSSIWTTFFTGWRIPLINITPAVMIFGVLSFMVAIKFMYSIFTITSSSVSHRDNNKKD